VRPEKSDELRHCVMHELKIEVLEEMIDVHSDQDRLANYHLLLRHAATVRSSTDRRPTGRTENSKTH
jgi:hypothetical protein